MADRGDAELIFVRQVKTVQAIDQLSAVGHRHFFGMTVEGVERHPAENGVAQGRNLFQLVARRQFAAGADTMDPTRRPTNFT